MSLFAVIMGLTGLGLCAVFGIKSWQATDGDIVFTLTSLGLCVVPYVCGFIFGLGLGRYVRGRG